MKDLFDPALIEDTKRRIMRPYPESERLWGNMTPTQTLAHCTSGILMAMGVINPKRASFPANVIGPLLKPLVFSDDKPMRRHRLRRPNRNPDFPWADHRFLISHTNCVRSAEPSLGSTADHADEAAERGAVRIRGP
jgi:hypothetical protein